MTGPFKGKFKVTSGYRTPERPDHNGLDLVGLEDKNIYAPCDGIIGASGIVTNKNDITWEWGNFVRLDVADGHSIYMCHMASRAVTKGQKVKKGDKLGVMGYTGYVLPVGPGGTHTHFEVRKTATNKPVNPCDYSGIPNKTGIYENNARDYKVDSNEIRKLLSENRPEEWSKEAVEWALKNEIMYGDGTGNLQLKEPCTREQVIVFIHRLYGLIKGDAG